MLAIIPLILAQFAAMDSIANRLIGADYQLAFQLDYRVATAIAATAVVLMINLRSIQVGASNHLGWIMAAAGLLLLPALWFSAWVSVTSAFGGLSGMNSWVIDSGQRFIVQRMDFSYSLFTIFLAAGFACPINFSLLVSDNISDRQTGMTSWAYPLLVLLACIPVFPLLWSGISVQSASPLQDYLFALPALAQHPVIAGLGSASILLLGISLTCSLTLIMAKIALNSFVLPSKELHQQEGLRLWINRGRCSSQPAFGFFAPA